MVSTVNRKNTFIERGCRDSSLATHKKTRCFHCFPLAKNSPLYYSAILDNLKTTILDNLKTAILDNSKKIKLDNFPTKHKARKKCTKLSHLLSQSLKYFWGVQKPKTPSSSEIRALRFAKKRRRDKPNLQSLTKFQVIQPPWRLKDPIVHNKLVQIFLRRQITKPRNHGFPKGTGRIKISKGGHLSLPQNRCFQK